MSKGFYTAQKGHVVNVLPPVDITGGKTGQCFSMADAAHASIIMQIGVSAAAPGAVTVNACSDNSGTGATAIAFDVFKQETAGASNDVLGTRTACTTAGFTPAATHGIFYVIEIDGDNLPAGKPYLQLSMANTSNSVIASAVAILSGLRYGGDQNPTATA